MRHFQLHVYHGENKLHCRDVDDVYFLPEQHIYLAFYSASSLKQQSKGRHVVPFGKNILIVSRTVFAPYSLLLCAYIGVIQFDQSFQWFMKAVSLVQCWIYLTPMIGLIGWSLGPPVKVYNLFDIVSLS